MAEQTPPAPGEITLLLADLYGQGADVLPEMIDRLYLDLRQLAASLLRRERGAHTLQPTALVHEAYLRLAKQDRVRWCNRTHFISVAARLMRRVLVDHARSNRAGKRGAGATRVTLSDEMVTAPAPVDLLDLDRAMTALSAADPRQAQVVDLRYFGGLSIDETASAMGLSPATVKREWQMARAWLVRELQQPA